MSVNAFINPRSMALDVLTTDVIEADDIKCVLPEIGTKVEFFQKVDLFRHKLPQLYGKDLWNPILRKLQGLSAEEFVNIQPGSLEHTIAQIVLQHMRPWYETGALQQAASDIWNTFTLGANACPSENCRPPIVFWSNDEWSPWAQSNHSIRRSPLFSDAVPFVSFPTGYSERGVASWTIMGHEMAHTILHTNPEALEALQARVDAHHGQYWKSRVSETAADVMNVLYMGPTAAMGMIAFLRGKRGGSMASVVPVDDVHASDIWRTLVMVQVANCLSLNWRTKEKWLYFLLEEIRDDFNEDGMGMTFSEACTEALAVAQTFMQTPIFDGKSLADIKSWNQEDEALVSLLAEGKKGRTTRSFRSPHIIAAANQILIEDPLLPYHPEKVETVFKGMIGLLKGESERHYVLLQNFLRSQWASRLQRQKQNKSSNIIVKIGETIGGFFDGISQAFSSISSASTS